MNINRLQIKLSLPWWASMYVNSVIIFADTLGLEPNWDKVAEFLGKHIRFSV